MKSSSIIILVIFSSFLYISSSIAYSINSFYILNKDGLIYYTNSPPYSYFKYISDNLLKQNSIINPTLLKSFYEIGGNFGIKEYINFLWYILSDGKYYELYYKFNIGSKTYGNVKLTDVTPYLNELIINKII